MAIFLIGGRGLSIIAHLVDNRRKAKFPLMIGMDQEKFQSYLDRKLPFQIDIADAGTVTITLTKEGFIVKSWIYSARTYQWNNVSPFFVHNNALPIVSILSPKEYQVCFNKTAKSFVDSVRKLLNGYTDSLLFEFSNETLSFTAEQMAQIMNHYREQVLQSNLS